MTLERNLTPLHWTDIWLTQGKLQRALTLVAPGFVYAAAQVVAVWGASKYWSTNLPRDKTTFSSSSRKITNGRQLLVTLEWRKRQAQGLLRQSKAVWESMARCSFVTWVPRSATIWNWGCICEYKCTVRSYPSNCPNQPLPSPLYLPQDITGYDVVPDFTLLRIKYYNGDVKTKRRPLNYCC